MEFYQKFQCKSNYFTMIGQIKLIYIVIACLIYLYKRCPGSFFFGTFREIKRTDWQAIERQSKGDRLESQTGKSQKLKGKNDIGHEWRAGAESFKWHRCWGKNEIAIFSSFPTLDIYSDFFYNSYLPK
jgi:hypothetical protein